MTQIFAYLTFDGVCREAMSFYQECLGGDLTLQTVQGSPMEAQCPVEKHRQILHSSLTRNGMILMASDMVTGRFVKGNDFALSVNCSSEEEINTFYTRLSKGGKVIDPLKVQFWGAMFGVLNDKYGVRWMLSYDMRNP